MESKRFVFSSGSYKKIRGRIEYDLHIVTYHSVSLRMELNIWQLQELFSKKAFSFFSKRLNSYVIAYNDVLPLTEAVYQVFHEIGHIYYGHISPGNSIAISLESQERVANHFAAFIFSKIGGAKIMKTLTGNEHFTYEGMPAGILLSDFWAWNSSDLLNNTLRGALAEFLVASAIGIDTSEARQDWTPYDLLSPSGRKIEVKCSAYLQSWNADRLSKIQFSIRPARSWDSENDFSDDVKRWSDLYVFCLYASKDRSETPLQLEQWEFYLLPTSVLNIRCKDQKSISLSSLLSLSPTKATYEELREAVENLDLGSTPPLRTSVLIFVSHFLLP